MRINQIIKIVESSISNKEEKSYFFTHVERYKKILSEIQKISGDRKLIILDVGCFPYHLGRILEILGHTIYGISSKHEPVKNGKISIINIENEKFPYPSNFFDLILMSEVIEHLPQSPLLSLEEARRVLKKEGLIVITTPNIARSINRIKIMFGKNIMYPIDMYFENSGRGNLIYHRHNREYTLTELKDILSKTEWRSIKGSFFISYTPWRKRIYPDFIWLKLIKIINFLFMVFVPGVRDTLFVVAKK